MPILTNEMMRSIIMDHYSAPINKRDPIGDGYESLHMNSDNCIDDIYIYIKVVDGKVVDSCFNGVACTISTSSTDIMCELLKEKTADEARYIIKQYDLMLHEQPFDADALEEANAFINTSKQAARIRCASIGWSAADQILKDK